jgi:hypothetical protein
MLGYVRHRLAGLARKILDGAFALSQKLQQFESASARQRFAYTSELREDLIFELALLIEPHS